MAIDPTEPQLPPDRTGAGTDASSAATRRHRIAWAIVGLILCVAYGPALLALLSFASSTALYSYILGVPVCCGYLIHTLRNELPANPTSSPIGAAVFGLLAIVTWLSDFMITRSADGIPQVDRLSLHALSLVCFCYAAGFALKGTKWMSVAAFPIGFLLFIIPLPSTALTWIETTLQSYSADAAAHIFNLIGTPVVRDGFIFDLPGFSLQVAQECSGVQASWILFVTTVLISYLMLRSPWRRLALILAVIPLGIIRNGIRIVTIGLLCVHNGPHIADSFIHKRGGPIFLALSLIPFAILLWLLTKGDQSRRLPETPTDAQSASA